MGLRKTTPLRISPTAPSLFLLPQDRDDRTMSIHSSTMSNPQTRLLQRWTSIYERMSHARLSCDAVIRLNRSLDLADEVVCDGAAMGEDSKILKKAAVCETPRLDLSRRSLGEVDESANLLSTAPNYAAQYMEPREYEILLARLTEAVDLLRHRQQEFKVCEFSWGRTKNFIIEC